MAPSLEEDSTEPLLDPSNGPVAEAAEAGNTDKQQTGVWAAEFRHILVLSAPAIVQLCTQQALVITNQARRLSDLCAAGLSTSLQSAALTDKHGMRPARKTMWLHYLSCRTGTAAQW